MADSFSGLLLLLGLALAYLPTDAFCPATHPTPSICYPPCCFSSSPLYYMRIKIISKSVQTHPKVFAFRILYTIICPTGNLLWVSVTNPFPHNIFHTVSTPQTECILAIWCPKLEVWPLDGHTWPQNKRFCFRLLQ